MRSKPLCLPTEAFYILWAGLPFDLFDKFQQFFLCYFLRIALLRRDRDRIFRALVEIKLAIGLHALRINLRGIPSWAEFDDSLVHEPRFRLGNAPR